MRNGAQDRGPAASGPDQNAARGFTAALREQAQDYTGKRKADAARVVSDVGDAIRGTGASFDGLPQLKAFFDQAALGVDELAEDIGRRSFSEMYDEVQAAARRRPALTAAAAMLAGFALYRLINAPGIRPVPRSRALVPVDVLPTPDI
ncbi:MULTISPECIES: hypothetical protein [Methylobacterium]|jgi:hypothetical protein|nr:hypothetical protein [Methylobacterium sp. ARG-1]KNY19593.1 hypothetical protein AKJ13_26815 [Methylobacterium sp. ARG-1]CAA2160487.1 hypothetical protein MBRA_05642 [Methylobacterium brachiatum]